MTKQSLELRSCVSSICELESFVNTVTRMYCVHEEKYPDILISLTEAVNNAIVHGNKKDNSKYVKVLLNKTPRRLTFVISDEGSGFNPTMVPDPTSPENIGCCGGRGVFLIKQLADKVNFSNNGSTVEISFKI